jgi:hypothetical protein
MKKGSHTNGDLELPRKACNVSSNAELSRLLGVSIGTVRSWNTRGLTSRQFISIIKKLSQRSSLDGEELVGALKKVFRSTTNRELAAQLGVQESMISYRGKHGFTANHIALILEKSRNHSVQVAVKPIIEFMPVRPSGSGDRKSFFDKSSDHRFKKIIEQLDEARDIYVFYNSQGQAIYAGKAVKLSLLAESTNAYNRKRNAQKIFKVVYPEKMKASDIHSHRQIREVPFRLLEVAAYFSAYEVEIPAIASLEATIIRLFPNDLLNKRMERHGVVKRKKK